MNKSLIIGCTISVMVFFTPTGVLSQPFFDAAGITMWQIPENNSNGATETEGLIFISLPVDLGSGNKLMVSPYYETRFLHEKKTKADVRLQSSALPITWLHYFGDSAWSFTLSAIVRSNDVQFRFNEDVFQAGGAFVGIYRVNSSLKLKAGGYYNREFFGNFFIPLVGLEWEINDRLNLFGLLPNSLKLEYRITKKLYGGVSFKSITNSYRIRGDGGYYKISDNHLGIYADGYIGKRIVWFIDSGHTIFRALKAREGGTFPELNNDGLIFKTGFIYRIRLDE